MKTLSFLENNGSGNGSVDSDGRIESFIAKQVQEKGLDGRTEKAYRLDLEHLHVWLKQHGRELSEGTAIEDYLRYLFKAKNLKASTITRKYRVYCYYIKYLASQGVLPDEYVVACPVFEKEHQSQETHALSKAEIDAFFVAMDQEYESLDQEFRRRVCLRDRVMMELLFYHGIEISELLGLKVSDYDRRTGILRIQGKREKGREEYVFSRVLKNRLEGWLKEHVFFERDPAYADWLFLSKVGRPLSMKMVILVFDKYRELAGIEKGATPKDLKCSMKGYARELMVERCS